MKCIYCNGETRVVNSRPQKRNNQIWRRRRCVSCGAIVTTHESINLSSLLIVDVGTKLQPFSIDRLFTEVLLAVQEHKNCYEVAREVTDTIVAKLLRTPGKPVYDTKQISKTTAQVLKRLDRHAWLRYIAEHPSVAQKRL